MRVVASFSGGKDSVLSIDRAMQHHEVVGLVTTFRDKSSWFHELSEGKMRQLADAMQMEFFPIRTIGGDQYTEDFSKALMQLAEKYSLEGIVFGDIDLETHRSWCESLAKRSKLQAIFPLWGEHREALVAEFLDKGYRTLIKKVDKSKLGTRYLGKILDSEILDRIKAMGYDPCGENGEYHTMVFDGPIFIREVDFRLGRIYEDNWSYHIEIC